MSKPLKLKSRQKIGKYRIEGRLATGPYATVYAALDTIEHQRVALKIPNVGAADKEFIDDFKREARLAARLYHPNILPLKDASFVEGHLLIVTPLGKETLATRLERRMSGATMVSFCEQLLDALAYAHEVGVLHCDIKPENLILFEDNHLMLADFGIAKRAAGTIKASGSGTLGYVAPEQAMGRPSPRSDVFAAGLIIYKMFAGKLPEWPYRWPLVGQERLRTRVTPQMTALLRRALEVEPARRYRDADHMLKAFMDLKRRGKVLKTARKKKTPVDNNSAVTWRDVRYRQFQRQYGRALQTDCRCKSCDGPMAQSMHACPWCGDAHKKHSGETKYPAICPSCHRGVKLDWEYCAWCYSAGFEVETTRHFSDKRYSAQCEKVSCGGPLMPYMRYCPWCHGKVKKKWPLAGGKSDRCGGCGWGVTSEYWAFCPWCTKSI